MNRQYIERINELSNKIRDNVANLNDYEEYQSLLIRGGFTEEQILHKLKDANISSYQQLIHKRYQIASALKQRNAGALEERKIIEGVAVVGLVALGLALIFKSLRGSNA